MAEPIGFFAYPSTPAAIPEIIWNSVKQINQSGTVHLKRWEDMQITGKVIIAEICREIDNSDFFCADLTTLNPNVLFELGYAIARKKRVWLLLDVTRVKQKTHFEKLKLLTTVGYAKYCNSNDILRAFYSESPHNDLKASLFSQMIEPDLRPAEREKIFHLKGTIDNEAEIRIVRRLEESPGQLILDDPRETSGQSLSWYAKQVYSSAAVLCHLTHPSRADSPVHTAKQSLVAGMAYGFNRKLLIIAEDDFLAPIDYRDIMRNYSTAAEALTYLEHWLKDIEPEIKTFLNEKKLTVAKLNLATELKNLDLGEPIAENEDERLLDQFFVETGAYLAAARGQQRIFVGRKGTGKTANLRKLNEDLSKSQRNLVCIINPASYEIQGIARLLSSFKQQDDKGYAIEGLWKYLLYTEIANSAVTKMSERRTILLENEELELQSFVASNLDMQEDFSLRLETCIQKLLDVQDANLNTMSASRKAVSEVLHSGVLKQLREKLITGLHNKKRIIILVDNLDKAWDQHADVNALAEVLLGLLSVANQLGHDFRRKGEREQAFAFNVAVFLRADIFQKVSQVAREPDKLLYHPVMWGDQEQLFRVIEERYRACQGGEANGGEIWTRFFCERVRGTPIRDYIMSRIFPRPRDLLVFVNAAIAKAINKGHACVEEKDVLQAEKEYSDFAVASLCVEDSVSTIGLENILIEFAGLSPILTDDQVVQCLSRGKIPIESIPAYTHYLCSLGFLGVEVADGEFRFAEDPSDIKKIAALGMRWTEMSGSRKYKINTPFWAYLELKDDLLISRQGS